jgi:hypothetical protein
VAKKQFDPEKVLRNWRTVSASLTKMTEEQVMQCLNREVIKAREDRRDDIVHRLHRRFTKLRQARELKEYLS